MADAKNPRIPITGTLDELGSPFKWQLVDKSHNVLASSKGRYENENYCLQNFFAYGKVSDIQILKQKKGLLNIYFMDDFDRQFISMHQAWSYMLDQAKFYPFEKINGKFYRA